jgi:hypothetical protein
MIVANHSETAQLIKSLLEKPDELLAVQPPNDQPELICQHLEALRNLLFSWQSVDFSPFKEKASSEMTEKITSLENAITALEQTQAVVALVQRAEQFLEKAQPESVQSDLILYDLSSADSIIRQLALLVPEVETTTSQLTTLSVRLEQTKEAIATCQS